MACAGCSVGKESKPSGCGSNGGCGSGSCSCNRKNSYDWLNVMEIEDVDPFQMVEVSFKNGARKEFYYNPPYTHAYTGDMVTVESRGGFDIGQITLSGELVRLQMKKKKARVDGMYPKVLRLANERDLERLHEARLLEPQTLSRAKAVSRTLGLDMKVGDVEYQGDLRKLTFYYTADGRIDFRELIRHYNKEFRVKIEMRQIGARQESGRIGGIGSCGRELCCSTWLSDFKSVVTAAARYQNLAINQTKLSGQCGRLKCCLNYELDTYMDALSDFPKKADTLYTRYGKASHIKTDIFKGLMHYFYKSSDRDRGRTITLTKERVKDIIKLNKKGEKPLDLKDFELIEDNSLVSELDFESVNEVIELPKETKPKRKKNRRRKKGSNRNKPQKSTPSQQPKNKPASEGGDKPASGKSKRRRNNRRRNNRNSNKNDNSGSGKDKPSGN